ncbi:protein 4.1b isoform X2 [Myxocyprinus asiaticus]|uniref:protein 4.1b isoform X2 n=1 Tax=Myxocyprinus asiaticus TaxID=70543 RepID=UPI0022233643|nr:protein 4.1b isoform X2 [Myxocyprinus asiaticus]
MLQCRVNFLDDTHFVWELERNAVGQELFNKVCEHLNLLERDFCGLVMWDSPRTRVWLDCTKEIQKQIKGSVAEFFFNIKFYPPDPAVLAEDITRYLLCLQLRNDIMTGRLPCPSDMLALLGSYTVQSILRDYDPNLHKNNYVSKIVLAPNQSEELEERVMELHSTHRYMIPAQADMLFLENAKTLPMYGVDLHPAKDVSGAEVMLGVCSEGLKVYQDEIKINSFAWPRVLKISHKRSTFLLKMRPTEDETEGVVRFSLPNYRACKQLWKCSVEHHSFFRNRLQDTKAQRFLNLGSRFHYHGRTQSECLEESANITRAPPQFTRFAIQRRGDEEILEVLKQPIRTELDEWFLVLGSDKWNISASDDVMLESKKLQEWKQHADDWFVLLDSSLFSPLGLQQLLHTEEQGEVEVVEEKEAEESLTDEFVIKHSYKVQEGPVEVEGQVRMDIIEKKHTDYEFEQEIVEPFKEMLKEEIIEVYGERTQRVVITKQWTQEVNSFVESQDDVLEKTIERVETVERCVMVTEGQKLLNIGSEETFERLEMVKQRLEEVEAIGQKLQEVEALRAGLQEVEHLEQRLQQVEKEGLQQVETADWYILLDRSPSMFTITLTAKEELQQLDTPKPMEWDDDWYLLLEMLPRPIDISPPLPDAINSMFEEDRAEEERREPERKIQLELLPPEEPKTQSREQVTVELYEENREGMRTMQKQQLEQVTIDYRRPQPGILEQQAEQPQSVVEDDSFIILDVSPKGSVPLAYPHLRSTVDLHEEIREEVPQSKVRTVEVHKKQQEQVTAIESRPVMLEKPQRDMEDDWCTILDVSPKESVPLAYPHLQSTTVELYEETREKKLQSRVSTEEQVIEVTTLSTKEQILAEKRMSVIQNPQAELPVVPREADDDWFLLNEPVPFDQRSFQSVSVTPETRLVPVASLEAEEKRAVERGKIVEMQKEQHKLVTVVESRSQPDLLEDMAPQPHRDMEDAWFIISDVSSKEPVPLVYPYLQETSVELYEETREGRVRRVEEVMTVSTQEQTVITEKMSVIQQPQEFPVVSRDIDDDWFQLFDAEPYDQRSFPSGTAPDVRSQVIEVRELTKDQRVQRIMEEQMREKQVTTVEKRVIIDEHRERADIIQQKFPVGDREFHDDWFELLNPTPFENRSVLSVGTEERRIKEQEMRMKQQEERRVREKEERQKKELEDRRAQPFVTEQSVEQPQREVEDNWFILFDVSPKETVVADVIKVDKRAEEEKRRREDERRKQIQVDDRQQKRPAIPEKKTVQLQREVEDDWFTFMGVSPKDSVPTYPAAPVISPVVPPKTRPQIPVDQPLTSTPTTQPVSITKTIYQERKKDIPDITLESEADESVLLSDSRRWTKRIEGESIYVRHSILMLEDFDVTQEVILRHHASISELKRVFMEPVPDFGPTEWDRRLSSYLPAEKTQLLQTKSEILIRMGLIEDDGKTLL